MTNEERRRSEELRRKIKRDRVFLNNPVVMQGLGLAPLVVAATSLKNAVILGVAVLLLLTPTRILAALLSRFSYFRFRGLTYAFSAALIYVGVRWCVGQLFPATDIAPLGLYLPLLAADPIILKRYERPQRERVGTALRKGVITSIGYVLVMLIARARCTVWWCSRSPSCPLPRCPAAGSFSWRCLWRCGAALSRRQNTSLG